MDKPGFLHGVFVAIYLLALVGVGAWKARKVRSQEDFSLAGRGLSTFVLVGTLLATWIGTGSIFSNAEESYRIGVSAFVLPISGAVGIVVLFLLASRIRSMEHYTIQDILEQRFGVGARLVGTLTLLCAYVIIVSYQYRAGAAVLSYLFPALPVVWATVAVAGFVVVYTALAGMISVAYTDVANGILMAIGIAIALPVLVSDAGGLEGIQSALGPERTSYAAEYGPIKLLSILLPTLFLILGDANMYQRFFSAKDAATAKRSTIGMFFGVIVMECAIIATAIVGAALVAQGKLEAPENPAHIIVAIAFQSLPPFLGAMLVATVVAVVVSTADSYLLAPSTSLVRDVYQRFVSPNASDSKVVFIGRLTVVLLGVLALFLAFQSKEFFSVALFAYTVYGASITPALLAALFWPRATKAAAVASMVTGLVSSIAWRNLIEKGALSSWFEERGNTQAVEFLRDLNELGLDAILPSVTLSIVVLALVTLVSGRKS